jgi:hypothetical protein
MVFLGNPAAMVGVIGVIGWKDHAHATTLKTKIPYAMTATVF